MKTHRIAVDSINEGISTTYCNIVFSLYDDVFQDKHTSQKPTCRLCLEKLKFNKLTSNKVTN